MAAPTGEASVAAASPGRGAGALAGLRGATRFARQQPVGAVAAGLLVLVVALALLAPALATHPPNKTSVDILAGAGGDHYFGTDRLGRDLFTRTLYGARISLWVGLISIGIGTGLGTVVGLVSGYFGGGWDLLIQRLMDSVLAIPALILALAIVTVLGHTTTNVIAAIAVVLVPGTSRVVRGSVLSVKEEVYVQAARATGCSHLRIIFRHILPNVIAPIIVLATMGLGVAILLEASLSFLGSGTPAPTASWGRDLSEGRAQWTAKPHVFWPPAVAITLTVFAFNLLGDSLRDALDPRLRRS